MVETRLAEEIRTSRTPVREALHMLEREGLLESIPRVGYRVKQIHWNEVEEVCEIRAVNETLAARWAMDRITHQELQALAGHRRTLECLGRKDRKGIEAAIRGHLEFAKQSIQRIVPRERGREDVR